MKRKPTRGLVYSTEFGKMCAVCGWPASDCRCSQGDSPPAATGPVRVARETKGRRGKGVTIITGIPLAGTELKTFAKQLKKQCGAGGTLKGAVLEIQGDHRDKLVEILRQKGWVVKKSGG